MLNTNKRKTQTNQSNTKTIRQQIDTPKQTNQATHKTRKHTTQKTHTKKTNIHTKNIHKCMMIH